jgi:hypothetical protein
MRPFSAAKEGARLQREPRKQLLISVVLLLMTAPCVLLFSQNPPPPVAWSLVALAVLDVACAFGFARYLGRYRESEKRKRK